MADSQWHSRWHVRGVDHASGQIQWAKLGPWHGFWFNLRLGQDSHPTHSICALAWGAIRRTCSCAFSLAFVSQLHPLMAPDAVAASSSFACWCEFEYGDPSFSVAPCACMTFLVPSCLVAIGGSSFWFTDLSLQVLRGVFLDLAHACVCPGNSSVPYWPLLMLCYIQPTFAQLLVDRPRDLVHRSIHSAIEHRSVTSFIEVYKDAYHAHVLSQGKQPKQCNLRHVVKISRSMALAILVDRKTGQYVGILMHLLQESSRDRCLNSLLAMRCCLFLCVNLRSALQTCNSFLI